MLRPHHWRYYYYSYLLCPPLEKLLLLLAALLPSPTIGDTTVSITICFYLLCFRRQPLEYYYFLHPTIGDTTPDRNRLGVAICLVFRSLSDCWHLSFSVRLVSSFSITVSGGAISFLFWPILSLVKKILRNKVRTIFFFAASFFLLLNCLTCPFRYSFFYISFYFLTVFLKNMPRARSKANYKVELLISIIEEKLPQGSMGWQEVAALYQL